MDLKEFLSIVFLVVDRSHYCYYLGYLVLDLVVPYYLAGFYFYAGSRDEADGFQTDYPGTLAQPEEASELRVLSV